MRDISKQVLSALMFDKINMEVALERGVTPEWFATGGHVFKYLTEVEEVWDKRSSMNVLEAAGLFDKHHEALQMCVETPEWAHDQSEVEQALEVLPFRCFNTHLKGFVVLIEQPSPSNVC